MRKENLLARLRLLSFLFFISGSFNIVLLAFFIYFTLKEHPPAPYGERKPVSVAAKEVKLNSVCAELMNRFKRLTFDELVTKLTETNALNHELKERDFALASLVSFYDFDIKKALASFSSPLKQKIIIAGSDRLSVIVGLRDEQFDSIVDFAKREKWPFRTRGLFQLLKKGNITDESLIDAFFLTPEFSWTSTLFARAEIAMQPNELLEILLEGDYGLLLTFKERHRNAKTLSVEDRQQFLIDYVKAGSKSAAHWLLKLDWEYAAHRLSDEIVLTILSLSDKKCEEEKRFASFIAVSPRGKSVRQLAEKRLLEYNGSKPAIQEKVLTNLKPKDSFPVIAPIKKLNFSQQDRIYVVQEGDSLWKIAKKYQLNVDVVRYYNRLNSDLLQPGTVLKIPS